MRRSLRPARSGGLRRVLPAGTLAAMLVLQPACGGCGEESAGADGGAEAGGGSAQRGGSEASGASGSGETAAGSSAGGETAAGRSAGGETRAGRAGARKGPTRGGGQAPGGESPDGGSGSGEQAANRGGDADEKRAAAKGSAGDEAGSQGPGGGAAGSEADDGGEESTEQEREDRAERIARLRRKARAEARGSDEEGGAASDDEGGGADGPSGSARGGSRGGRRGPERMAATDGGDDGAADRDGPPERGASKRGGRPGRGGRDRERPKLDVSRYLHLSDIQAIADAENLQVAGPLRGIQPGPNYNSQHFAPAQGDAFGVTLQVWKERTQRATNRRFERMKRQQPNVQDTEAISGKGFVSSWKQVITVTFAHTSERKVVSVSCSQKICSPRQLLEMANTVRNRL